MSDIVIGGTSGLGLEIAKLMSENGHEVIVTGRHDPGQDRLKYRELALAGDGLPGRISDFVNDLPAVGTLVYAAGFYQEGRVTDLSEQQIEDMIDVGGRALIYFVKALLHKQGRLDGLITVTSSSQWTPRTLEPVYNFAKAGAGHFSNAMAEDGRIGKVLVDGQFGMKTAFWRDTEHPDFNKMLDPAWAAAQVLEQFEGDYRYRFIKVHRDPPHVEVAETR